MTTQLGPLLRVFYDDGEACFHAFRDEPFVGDGAPPFAAEDAPQQWQGHALDGASGASGSPELPTLIVTVTAEDLESISPLVIKLVEQPSPIPLPQKSKNDILVDGVRGALRLVSRYRYTGI